MPQEKVDVLRRTFNRSARGDFSRWFAKSATTSFSWRSSNGDGRRNRILLLCQSLRVRRASALIAASISSVRSSSSAPEAGAMVESGPGELAVAAPAVGVDDRARLDDLAHPGHERVPG
jgi:hypothetical protein